MCPSGCTVTAPDCTRLHQILVNLVANALKFTSVGGIQVELSLGDLSPERCSLFVRVRDSGIGIDADEDEAVSRGRGRRRTPCTGRTHAQAPGQRRRGQPAFTGCRRLRDRARRRAAPRPGRPAVRAIAAALDELEFKQALDLLAAGLLPTDPNEATESIEAKPEAAVCLATTV